MFRDHVALGIKPGPFSGKTGCSVLWTIYLPPCGTDSTDQLLLPLSSPPGSPLRLIELLEPCPGLNRAVCIFGWICFVTLKFVTLKSITIRLPCWNVILWHGEIDNWVLPCMTFPNQRVTFIFITTWSRLILTFQFQFLWAEGILSPFYSTVSTWKMWFTEQGLSYLRGPALASLPL